MSREKEDFRPIMEQLYNRFGNREFLTIAEASQILGVCTRTLERDIMFPTKKIGRRVVVPIVRLARWMS
jgi:hypothetical protein